MNSLESLERATPEFRRLTQNQQNERRKFLSIMLNAILEQPSSLGLTKQQTVRFTSDLLEFHLTGKIERVTEEQKTPKKRKK